MVRVTVADRMASAIGLDWAGSGWIGVHLREDGPDEVDFFPTVLGAWHAFDRGSRILVDVPIGLPSDGKRACDEAAAEYLSPDRRSSVFWTPCRAAVYARTLEAAKDAQEGLGYSVSNQAWAIAPRIRELDEFFAVFPNALGTVRESHPEVCFAALNGGTPLEHAKSSEEGVAQRLGLLEECDPALPALYEDAVETFIDPPPHARRLSHDAHHDVLDAAVLAWTALREKSDLRTLPEDPPRDEGAGESLPMEIVYPAER